MKRVLVVDDDLDIREALQDVLGDSGYVVLTARDGIDALEQLRAGASPDVILLDWMMPRCDGLQFRTHQLADATIAAIPVILLTAHANVDSVRAQLAAAAYLAKPVTLDRLLSVLAEVCNS